MAEDKKASSANPRVKILHQFPESLESKIFGAPTVFENLKDQSVPLTRPVRMDVKVEDHPSDPSVFIIRLFLDLQYLLGEKEAAAFKLTYAVMALVENFSEDQMPPLLFVDIPRTVYPEVRHILYGIFREIGLPVYGMEFFNFGSLLEEKMKSVSKKTAKTSESKKNAS